MQRIWSKVMRVISKSDERAERKDKLKLLYYKYDFRPKLHDTKFNYHFITAILKSQNSVITNI